MPDRTSETPTPTDGDREETRGDENGAATADPSEKVKQTGRKAVARAREEASQRVGEGGSRAGQRLDAVGRALRTAADELDARGESWLAGYTGEAARFVDRSAGYMKEEDGSAMMADLRQWARENPGLVVGASITAGLALGRFLRSSDPTRRRGDGSGIREGSIHDR